MGIAAIRFYEELNDFLPVKKRKIRFKVDFHGNPSVKDLIESLGVPHTEIDLILVNGESVDFKRKIYDGDDISVYPEFESMDITGIQRLRPNPLRMPKFMLDVQLGKLAKLLRIVGLDVFYSKKSIDEELIRFALSERRTILTRSKGVLKRRQVTRGYFVRSTFPKEQLTEVLNRFDLKNNLKPFTRCLKCNSVLVQVPKSTVSDLLPGKVKAIRNSFYKCPDCRKLFWKGTHYENMLNIVRNL